jgi:hypothetical protein
MIPLDRRCDIYSLAATLWHALAGRSPFEITGGDNKQHAMMLRVRDYPVPALNRSDVPQSLERLLRQSLNKEPRRRPRTAADFAMALNGVEEELGLRITPFKVARESRTVETFAPGPGNHPGLPMPGFSHEQSYPAPLPALSDDDATQLRSPQVFQIPPDLDPTRRRSGVVIGEPEATPIPEPRASFRTILIGCVALAVVAAAAVSWIVLGPEPAPPIESPTLTINPGEVDQVEDTLPGVPRIVGVIVEGEARFTWTYERFSTTDIYFVDGPAGQVKLDQPRYTTAYNGEEVCIGVRVSRASGANAQVDFTEGCVS